MFSFYERGEWEGDTERVELLNVLAIKVRDVWVWGLAGGGNNPTDHSIGHVRVKKSHADLYCATRIKLELLIRFVKKSSLA